MAGDQEERNFEVVKLRIAFLQHITTLSGAAILIMLALIERAETGQRAFLLATTAGMFLMAALISVVGVVALLLQLVRAERVVGGDRATAGGLTSAFAGSAFASGITFAAFFAAGGTLQLFRTIAYAYFAVFFGLTLIFFILRFPLGWLLRWILRK